MFGIRVDEEGVSLRARRQPYFNHEFVFMMDGGGISVPELGVR